MFVYKRDGVDGLICLPDLGGERAPCKNVQCCFQIVVGFTPLFLPRGNDEGNCFTF